MAEEKWKLSVIKNISTVLQQLMQILKHVLQTLKHVLKWYHWTFNVHHNINWNNWEAIKRSYIQCGPLFKERKSLEPSPLEELESAPAAWLNQAYASNVSVDGTIIR